MSANPIVDVLQMMMQMYGDMTDTRSNIQPGSGRPGTTSVNPNVNMLVDMAPQLPNRPEGPTRAEIDAITKSVMYEKMLKREMEESQLAPQMRQLQKMNPDIWRYLDQLKPMDDPNFRQYLEPDTPDEIGLTQSILKLAGLTDPYRSSVSALVPDKVLGDTDEDVEINIPKAARGMMRTEPSQPRPTALTPELMRMISDQYERFPDANPLNNPELNEYLEEDTEEPIG